MHAAAIRVLRFCDPVIIIVSLVSVPCNRPFSCLLHNYAGEDHETPIIINHNYVRQEGGDVSRVNISPGIIAVHCHRHQ